MSLIKNNKAAIAGWLLFAAIAVMAIISLVYWFRANTPLNQGFFNILGSLLWGALPIEFAFLAALILSHQPRNVIGWLLILPAIAEANNGTLSTYFGSFTTSPLNPSIALILAYWFHGWSWLLLIFPIFFILLLFPTGRPVSPRWRWSVIYVFCVCAYFFIVIAFQQNLSDESYNITIRNPVGFISDDFTINYLLPTFTVGLLSVTLIAIFSIIARYRRATVIEREQIKWLLYACVIFAAVYAVSVLLNLQSTVWGSTGFWYVAGAASIMIIPVAIAIAVLRYRLWDIDILIRKTLVYGALTLTLALVYFGSVVLLQSLVAAVGGQQSAVITVISTLLIAALFTPLRRRIQRDIDRRFYRKKYDAEKTIAVFSAGLRQEVDLEQIGEQLLSVVEDTMQPEVLGLWLKPTPKRN